MPKSINLLRDPRTGHYLNKDFSLSLLQPSRVARFQTKEVANRVAQIMIKQAKSRGEIPPKFEVIAFSL